MIELAKFLPDSVREELFRPTGEALGLPGNLYGDGFFDGLHRAEQVSRDIKHALEMTTSDGLIILHDCNPPHHELAREKYDSDGVAGSAWNGTTWKATWEFFFSGSRELKVVDSDRGVGIIDKSKPKDPQVLRNPFFEFDEFAATKHEVGYLLRWEATQAWLAS